MGPATDTIYDPYTSPKVVGDVAAAKEKRAQDTNATADQAPVGKTGKESQPAADPVVDKVRTLLGQGAMTVTGRELHNGTDSWAISLKADFGRPVWTLWVSVADGKPVELSDPGRNASEQPQVIRWPVYEVLGDDTATQQLLTLTGAHPSIEAANVAASSRSTRSAARRSGRVPPRGVEAEEDANRE